MSTKTQSPSPTGTPGASAPVPSAKQSDKPRVNNITTHPSTFCCGLVELGNFNYVDPPGGKKMIHYHKLNNTWAAQQNQEPNTKEDVLERMKYITSGVVASTGAGQEYMDPILADIGFRHVFTFINPGHAQTPVKIWCYSKHEV